MFLSPSAHPTEGAQPGNPGATWMRVLGGSRGRACGSELASPWSSLVGRASCWAGLAGQRPGEGRGQTGGDGGGSPRLFWQVLGGGAGVPEEIQAPALGVKAPDLPPLRRAN